VDAVGAAAMNSPVDSATFSAWVRKHPEATSFLDTLRQVARVELGICPVDPKEEAAVIAAVYKVWM
jgi:hypothetical protein